MIWAPDILSQMYLFSPLSDFELKAWNKFHSIIKHVGEMSLHSQHGYFPPTS